MLSALKATHPNMQFTTEVEPKQSIGIPGRELSPDNRHIVKPCGMNRFVYLHYRSLPNVMSNSDALGTKRSEQAQKKWLKQNVKSWRRFPSKIVIMFVCLRISCKTNVGITGKMTANRYQVYIVLLCTNNILPPVAQRRLLGSLNKIHFLGVLPILLIFNQWYEHG